MNEEKKYLVAVIQLYQGQFSSTIFKNFLTSFSNFFNIPSCFQNVNSNFQMKTTLCLESSYRHTTATMRRKANMKTAINIQSILSTFVGVVELSERSCTTITSISGDDWTTGFEVLVWPEVVLFSFISKN